MPENPTWEQVDSYAGKLTDKSKQQYGICLRGKPGWGENMAFFDTLLNTYGGEWFNMSWQAQLESKPWHDALTFYVHLLRDYGPPGASSNGFNENQALFATGHCAMWIDATSGAGIDLRQGQQPGLRQDRLHRGPCGRDAARLALVLVLGAGGALHLQAGRDREGLHQLGHVEGIHRHGRPARKAGPRCPPARVSRPTPTPDYIAAAPFAGAVKTAILTADLDHPTLNPVPYTGVQYVSIPEFESIGTTVGQLVAAALTGQSSIDATLKQAQASVSSTMQQAGYTQ